MISQRWIGNGLMPLGKKAITWDNVSLDLCRQMASQDHSYLNNHWFKQQGFKTLINQENVKVKDNYYVIRKKFYMVYTPIVWTSMVSSLFGISTTYVYVINMNPCKCFIIDDHINSCVFCAIFNSYLPIACHGDITWAWRCFISTTTPRFVRKIIQIDNK